MKTYLLILLLGIFSSSCNSQSSKVNLSPKLELIDRSTLKFEGSNYAYSKIDSVLSVYKNNVPTNLMDSIRIELVVNTNKVPMGIVGDIKNSLRKNKIMKVTYKSKK